MSCTDVLEQLSDFYDRELAGERRGQIRGHLTGCTTCSRTLDRYSKLSRLCHGLPDPVPAAEAWRRIETMLQATAVSRHIHRRRNRIVTLVALASIAAALLLGLTLFPVGDKSTHHTTTDRDLARNMGSFLDQFPHDPEIAQQTLLRNYSGKSINSDDAIHFVGYQPSALRADPQGYTLQNVYVLKMPCCVCIEAVFQGDDGRPMAVFEHAEEQPIWFTGRPRIMAQCNNKSTSIVELDGQLAITWTQQGRYITVIGVRNVEEATRLITHLDSVHLDLG